jgi:Fe-S cluster assembly ATP-binding protein
MLQIKNLHVAAEGKEILRGVSLYLKKGQIHAVMGPNGAGKSTLARVLAGDPRFIVTQGEIVFEGKNLLELSADQRAHLGMFLSFQDPLEIAGVNSEHFLYQIYNAKRKSGGQEEVSQEAFSALLAEKIQTLGFKKELVSRGLNAGFSGGEKKRSEILQMAILDPKLAILDETDSGLDVDALRKVGKDIQSFHSADKGLLIITHYHKLLQELRPHVVHVLVDGVVVAIGGAELADQIEQKGFDSVAGALR